MLNGLTPVLDLGVPATVSFGRNIVGVIGYPGCGDVLNQSSYGTDMVIRFDEYVGSEVTATIINDTGTATLTTKRESDNTVLAAKTFDTPGLTRFTALVPDLVSPFSATSTTADKSIVSTVLGNHGLFTAPAFRWTPSNGARSWFAVVVAFLHGISADVSGSGRIVEAYTSSTARLRFPSSFGVTTWSEVDTGITASDCCVRFLPDESILLVTATGSSINYQVSQNEGRTFSVATPIFSVAGTTPTTAVTPTGVAVHFCRTAAGAVLTKVLSPTGSVMIAETTVIAANVSGDGLAAFERYGRIYLVYSSTSGTIETVSSDNLTTYA